MTICSLRSSARCPLRAVLAVAVGVIAGWGALAVTDFLDAVEPVTVGGPARM